MDLKAFPQGWTLLEVGTTIKSTLDRMAQAIERIYLKIDDEV